jgi:hypothetical protein
MPNGQQIWLGGALAARTIRLRAGLDRVHILLDALTRLNKLLGGQE